MTYIPRSGAEALMPEEFQKEIMQVLPEQSAVMTLAYCAPNMSKAQRRIPVLSVLPTAYFLNPGPTQRSDASDIARKRLTRQLWENKYLDAEELAVIVALPEAVIADVDYDLWGEVKPKLVEAFGLAFDQAVFYGINAPAAWPTNITTAAESAGNLVVPGSLGANTDLYDELLGEDGVIAKVEEDGFMVSGHAAALTMRGKLRGIRDTAGNPIFKSQYKEGVQGATRYELDGEQIVFPRNGAMIPELGQLISGDWRQLVWSLRQDITWKILTEAVIQDPTTGEILYNLAQNDMVGLRAVMRIAWQVPNPVNRLKETEEERYPFAVYGQSAGS
jgi:HK97 family phage major capsid protein